MLEERVALMSSKGGFDFGNERVMVLLSTICSLDEEDLDLVEKWLRKSFPAEFDRNDRISMRKKKVKIGRRVS
jgi:hypothetical protein